MRKLYTLFLIFYVPAIALSQKIVELQKNISHYELKGNEIFFLEDATCQLNIDDIVNNKLKEFDAIPAKKINFSFSLSNYWFKIKLSNKEDGLIKRFLEINKPNLDKIELYELINEKEYRFICKTGDLNTFNKRPYNHRNYIFQLNFYANEERTFLILVNNGGEQFHFSMNLWSEKGLHKRDYFEQYFFGIYFGIILFVLIFNFFLYISFKEKLNLFYVLYIFSLGLLQLSLNGYSFELLWPNNTYLANRANPLFASAGVYYLLIFSIHFLKLKEFEPKIFSFFSIYKYLLLVCIIFSVIPGNFFYVSSVWSINALTLILNILILPVSYKVIKKGFYPARIFFAAFIVLVISVFAFVLNNFGFLPANVFTTYGLQFGSAVEVILLSLAIVLRFKELRDNSILKLQEANNLKQKINEELEIIVKERTETILKQKDLIEEYNVNIKDSINYAIRIQSAILPKEQDIKLLFDDFFTIYIPKDVISGDFYLAERIRTNDHVTLYSLAVADCTGHGVPGAMLSMLCSSYLRQSLTRHDVNSPAEALDYVDASLKNHFKYNNDTRNIKDGMDIGFAVFNKQKYEMYYSGANRNLIIIRNTELIEIKGDNYSVGSKDQDKQFTNKVNAIEPGDMVYLFTDGYSDQFGGPDNKKFKSVRLKKILLNISKLPLDEQKSILTENFYQWKGNTIQTDDICIFGLRIT